MTRWISMKRDVSNHISFFAFFDICVVGGVEMLENCNQTMNEIATIVSKANNKGEVMVLMDANNLKKKKDYAVSEYV